ncbi:hypothetical protein FQN50_009493 [Emmonsiellopsis sp. PD_5]|nr:hypothetical protein FQN50_009493 [Emmonsiellopsis sp. PD_5]
MGKPPAVIIIARHGARLDAVDKQWHLTSPTPYDPPLTYGGWNQSRALGLRIASLLQARDDLNDRPTLPNGPNNAVERAGEVSDTESGTNTPTRPRKHKIIIHTSPFLRCVQTAIGVSAGISQSRQLPPQRPHASSIKHHRLHSGSPVTRSHDGGDSPRLSAIPEPSQTPPFSKPAAGALSTDVQKCKLRLDAFLGEWLSPDYFEQISPPPSSVMMIAGAKSELLRRAEPIEAGLETDGKSLFGHFPGGWSNPFTNNNTAAEDENNETDGAFKNMSAMGYALANRNRSGSYDSGAAAPQKPPGTRISKITTDFPAGYTGYTPPTPTYAISPSDPIPTGYVSHACDACVDVDYQWDSMRDPQDWGNGGEYGEEWSSMHHRFRKGFHRMIDWYKSIDDSSSTQDDDDTDTILILITHGAGCNALIGAVTGQPVLLDIGTASLTMAVRKGDARGVEGGVPSNRPSHRRQGSAFRDLANEYEVSLVAATEHLRPGTHPTQVHHMPSPRVLPTPISSYRHRYGSNSGSISSHESFSLGDSAIRRQSSSRTPVAHARGASGRSSSGLWGSTAAADTNSESADEIVPNFGDPRPGSGEGAGKEKNQVPARSRSQHGLWGSVSIQDREQDREPTTKRRWTMTERNS